MASINRLGPLGTLATWIWPLAHFPVLGQPDAGVGPVAHPSRQTPRPGGPGAVQCSSRDRAPILFQAATVDSLPSRHRRLFPKPRPPATPVSQAATVDSLPSRDRQGAAPFCNRSCSRNSKGPTNPTVSKTPSLPRPRRTSHPTRSPETLYGRLTRWKPPCTPKRTLSPRMAGILPNRH